MENAVIIPNRLRTTANKYAHYSYIMNIFAKSVLKEMLYQLQLELKRNHQWVYRVKSFFPIGKMFFLQRHKSYKIFCTTKTRKIYQLSLVNLKSFCNEYFVLFNRRILRLVLGQLPPRKIAPPTLKLILTQTLTLIRGQLRNNCLNPPQP